MAAFFAPGGAGEILPRLSFLEPLLVGRRVLEIGGAGATDGASALLLAERGAASVLSLDDAGSAERAARLVTHPAVQFRHADPAHLPPAAFEVVVAHDGLGLAADPARLEALRALLTPSGVLLTAIPAPYGATLSTLAGAPPPSEADVPPYEHVAAALARVFPFVEAATQSPSVGYAVAAGEAGDDLPFRVDGSLAGPADVAFYLFLCAAAPTGLRGVSLVALPSRELWDRAQAAMLERAGAEIRAAEAAEAARAALERARGEWTEAAGAAEALAAQSGAVRAALREELDRTEAALARAYQELGRAGDRAAEAAARAAVAEHGLLDAGARLAAEREAAEDLRRSVLASGADGDRVRAELADSGARFRSMEASLRDDERRLADGDEARAELDRSDRSLARAYQELWRAGEAVEGARRAAEEAGREASQVGELRARLADAERWRAGLEEDRAGTADRLRTAEQGAAAHLAELARLRDEYARRGAELVESRRAASARAEQVAALAAEVEDLSRKAAGGSEPPPSDPAVPALEARVRELETALALAERARADAVAAPGRSTAPGDPPGALEKVVHERDAYAHQLADRETRIARMQREIADKTERLSRLAKELSAEKSRGAFGKLFQR